MSNMMSNPYQAPDNIFQYCEKCFNKTDKKGPPGSQPVLSETFPVTIDITNPKPTQIPRTQFVEKRNNHFEPEPFVNCDRCNRKAHMICANFTPKTQKEKYVCETCMKQFSLVKPTTKFSAKNLQRSALSDHIEKAVNAYLDENDKTGTHGWVHVRTLFITKRQIEIKPKFQARLVEEGYTDNNKADYTIKVIFAFEDIDGDPVCFWGLHVQEYGSTSHDINQRRIYISYLDSVQFFRPRELRTEVYHEILISYMEYCRNLGFGYCHIWACPPSEGDDYIFHCHPPTQKVPKHKRLSQWYSKMLLKAKNRKVIHNYDYVLDYCQKNKVKEPYTVFGYFEGDYWPQCIEDEMAAVEKEEKDKKKEGENTVDEEAENNNGGAPQKVSKKSSKKKASKKMMKHHAFGFKLY